MPPHVARLPVYRVRRVVRFDHLLPEEELDADLLHLRLRLAMGRRLQPPTEWSFALLDASAVKFSRRWHEFLRFTK